MPEESDGDPDWKNCRGESFKSGVESHGRRVGTSGRIDGKCGEVDGSGHGKFGKADARCKEAGRDTEGKKPKTVRRRNERERMRVKNVNEGFERLRSFLWEGDDGGRKRSKVDTLRDAIAYIKHLERELRRCE